MIAPALWGEGMEIVVLVVKVAATLLVVYGGVLCLGHQLLAHARAPVLRGRGARHARLIAEVDREVGKGVLSYLSI